MLPSVQIQTGLAHDGRVAVAFYCVEEDVAQGLLMTPVQARAFCRAVEVQAQRAEILQVEKVTLEREVWGDG